MSTTVELIILLALCLIVVTETVNTDLDLEMDVRVARCRLMCLKTLGNEGKCNLDVKRDLPIDNCEDCWRKCRTIHPVFYTTNPVFYNYFHCLDGEKPNNTVNSVMCEYLKAAFSDKPFAATMLPAPTEDWDRSSPLKPYNVLIFYHYDETKASYSVLCYYPECDVSYEDASWTIVLDGNKIYHYTDKHWRPTLDSLRRGPFFEASISWEHDDPRENKIRHYLPYNKLDADSNKLVVHKESVFGSEYIEENKKRYTVSWQPEDGSPLGNLVTTAYNAQISLLPGTRYFVRIAEDKGPGSDAIVIDTTNNTEYLNTYIQRNKCVDSQGSNTFVKYIWSRINIYTIIVAYLVLSIVIYIAIVIFTRHRKIREKAKLIEA